MNQSFFSFFLVIVIFRPFDQKEITGRERSSSGKLLKERKNKIQNEVRSQLLVWSPVVK